MCQSRHCVVTCWATATPKAELIVIIEWVNDIIERPIGETAPFKMDHTLQEQELCSSVDLVMARHLAQQAHLLEDHSLHLLNIQMLANLPAIALTEFFAI